jgi:hypothetical protein
MAAPSIPASSSDSFSYLVYFLLYPIVSTYIQCHVLLAILQSSIFRQKDRDLVRLTFSNDFFMFSSIVGRAVSFPGVVFWFSFLGAPAGVLSAIFYHMVGCGSLQFRFPTAAELFTQDQYRPLLKAGNLISMVSMGIIGRRTHAVFRNLTRRRRCPYFVVCVNDFCVIFAMDSLALLSFLHLAASPNTYAIAGFCYLFFTLSFHALIDYGAASGKRYVPFSGTVNALAGITGVMGAFGCSANPELPYIHRIGSALLTLCLVLLHLKFIFAGANLLGNRFIPYAAKSTEKIVSPVPQSSSSETGFL